MVRTCSVFGCLSTTTLNKDLRFHRFPRDARCQSWIDACRRPDLKDKNIDQLYTMFVCSLHFEKWMYMKMKLKNAAIPVLNLPCVSINSMSTQTEAPRIVIARDVHSRVMQNQVNVSSVEVSVAATSDHASQTAKKNTKKRKHRNEITKGAKKLKLEDAKSTDATREQFLQGCDKDAKSTDATREQFLQGCDKDAKSTDATREQFLQGCDKDAKSTDVTREQFLQGCDKFLSPSLSKIVKVQVLGNKL